MVAVDKFDSRAVLGENRAFLPITVLRTFDFLILPLRLFIAILHPNVADR